MAATTPPNTAETTAAGAAVSAAVGTAAEEANARTVHKRYEGLVMVRTKAIKGKGAWYWAHLEPILVHSSDTGVPKAVKLRCSLCDAVFSASNPSRTASEHLKRGTCPNFNNNNVKPISQIPPAATSPPPQQQHQQQVNHRKRSSSSSGGGGGPRVLGGATSATTTPTTTTSYHVSPLSIVDPSSRLAVELAAYSSPPTGCTLSSGGGTLGSGSGTLVSPHQQHHLQHQHHHNQHQQQQHLMLSGGKDDLGALAMLEDSVKKLKSPKQLSPGPVLTQPQIDTALDLLADWVFESCGSVSFSSLEHPKFKSFLSQVGLPPVSRKGLAGNRLETKYEEARAESEAKIRDAMFFQVSSNGWKLKSHGFVGEENLVSLSVNLPNGTSVFRKAVFTSGFVHSNYAEDVFVETMTEICGNSLHQCVGIVADKFKAKALRNLEEQHHWMVNVSCQYQAFNSLVKDFGKELGLFKNVTENCVKLANFVNNKSQVRNSFHKYQLQEYGHAGLLRVPLGGYERSDFGPVYVLVEDILSSARALQLVLLDESYKVLSMEEQIARDIEEMMRSPHFWNELEAVHSLVKLIKTMAQDIQTEKPRVGQCLPLWEELRVKVKDWCSKFHIGEGPVEKVIDRRFKKNYHPAWAAAFVLDPVYLIRDSGGKYLPPFKCLSPEQEKDVDKLITRLVSREEAHIALMELMKWRIEGLDPVYAQAVQVKQRDPNTGKMKIANPQSSRLVWETHLTEFKSLGKVAARLIFLRASSCGFRSNWSFLKSVNARSHSRVGMDKAQKLIFIAANSKLQRRDCSIDEDKDAELFTLANSEDDVLNEVFVDTSSV